MTEERWLPIPAWEGIYEVSNQGRVRSVDRLITQLIRGQRQRAHLRGRILKPSPKVGPTTRTGHLVVTLADTSRGRRRVAPVHHLVLETFVGPRPEGMEGCHENDTGTDNRLTNLRWDTRSGNVQDQVQNGSHNFLRSNRARWSA